MMSNLQHDTGSARQRGPRREHHSHRPHRTIAWASLADIRLPTAQVADLINTRKRQRL
jgi:hypothetical protein